MRARDGHHDREVADSKVTDAVDRGQSQHRMCGGDLLGDHPQLVQHTGVRGVAEAGDGAAAVLPTYRPDEQRNAAGAAVAVVGTAALVRAARRKRRG